MNKPISASSGASLLARVLRDRRGVEAIEFALIAPVLLIISLGVIEMSLLLYDYHLAGEATRRGARTAVIAAPIAELDGVKDADIVCGADTEGAVSCTGAGLDDEASFDTILASMQSIMPSLTANNLRVSYSASGVSADATAGIATPLVTVGLVGVVHALTIGRIVPGLPSEITFPPLTTSALAPSIEVSVD